MSDATTPLVVPPEPREVKLRQATIDFLTTQTQMTTAFFVIVFLCICLYSPLTSVPISGVDADPLKAATHALAGDNTQFINDINGNVNNLDYGYRPLFFVSILLQAIMFHDWIPGYHCFSIMLLIGCCTVLSLIVLEITGKYGNRLGACPALWTGLLFAVYPYNSALVAALTGQQPLLGSFFGLLTIFCFLRYRLVLETRFLVMALSAYIACMLSWENGALLPMVLTLTYLLPEPEIERPRVNWDGFLELVAPFWGTLALYASLRPHWTDRVGATLAGTNLDNVVINFWKFMLYSPEDPLLFPQLKALGLVLAVLILRLVIAQGSYKAALFLIAWCGLYLLQPNENWSAGFVAPLCATIVITFLPAIDRMGKATSALYATAGSQLLIVLLCYWTFKMLMF